MQHDLYTIRITEPLTRITMEWKGKSMSHIAYAAQGLGASEAYTAFGLPDRIFFDFSKVVCSLDYFEEKE